MEGVNRARRGLRAAGIVFVFVLAPIALALLVVIAFAVGLGALGAYIGALLAAWLLFAYVVPLMTGVMAPGELIANIRSRRSRRTHYEGEPLPDWNLVWLQSLLKKAPDNQ